jgi:uncharacterized membrane protein
MGFFNPSLLWFALGGSIPIIIHLLHRQKFKRVRWAAMEFLLAALQKTRRRMQLENLLLLLLRILVMVLLALAVARPFFHEAPLSALRGDSDTQHIFVIDTSYSMAYKRAQTTSLDVARKAALEVLKDIPGSEQDRYTLLPLNSYPAPILRNRNQKNHLQAGINELKVSDYGTSVHATMLAVRDLLDDPEIRNQDRRIYLFTDLQRIGWEFRDEQEAKKFGELLKQLSHRDRTKFYIYDAGTADAWNVAVVDLRVNDPVVTTKRSTRLTADVHNYSSIPRPSVTVNLFVDDNFVKPASAVLPPNATQSVSFDYDFTEAGPHFVEVRVDPDFLDVDDRRYLSLDVKSALRGLVIDGEPKDTPKESATYPLVTALDPTRQGLYFSLDVRTADLFNGEGLDAYDFMVLANVQSLTTDKVEKIENFVRRGGGLLVTLGGKVDKVSFNDSFWSGGKGLSPAALDETVGELPGGGLEVGSVHRVSKFTSGHPVFRTFQKRAAPALYGLVFHRFFRVKEFDPERVLASFDDNFNSPLFLEKRFEEGKVLLFTSTIDGDWTNMPAHPPFLPLMWDVCRYLAARPVARRNLFVGDLIQIDLPVEQYQPPFVLDTPVEGSVTLPANAPDKDQKFIRLFHPAKAKSNDPKKLDNEGLRNAGKYRLTRSAQKDDEKLVAYFAVNVPPRTTSPEEVHLAEGNLERISKEQIQQMYPDFKAEFVGEKNQGRQEIDLSQSTSGLWKSLLYLLVGFLLLESVLACLFGRGKH